MARVVKKNPLKPSRFEAVQKERNAASRARFEEIQKKSSSLLEQADIAHENMQHAMKYMDRSRSLFHNLHLMFTKGNSNARVAMHYSFIHSVLEYVSKGDLRGKHILHLGASTGVYVRFLQDFCDAKAVALDLNKNALNDAASRGVKNVVHGNAIPVRIRGKPVHLSNRAGVLIPREKRTKLRFKDKEFDFLISDHFLFSNFHKGLKEPGFERFDGSFEESEHALKEYNRIMKKGGRIIITGAHNKELENLGKYRKWFKIHGFFVEKIFDEYGHKVALSPDAFNVYHPNKLGPMDFVLKKINDL